MDSVEMARNQPGVAELMEVYRQYQIVEQAARVYQKLFGVKYVISLSDSSKAVSAEEGPYHSPSFDDTPAMLLSRCVSPRRISPKNQRRGAEAA